MVWRHSFIKLSGRISSNHNCGEIYRLVCGRLAGCRQNLSKIGAVVEKAILQISEHYPMISVDKYCIMPDHVHMILSINTDDDGRQIAAPTILTVVGHMKRWVSIQIERSIWQKSFADKIIRNDRMYRAVWEYIENNPIKMDTAYDMPDFDNL